MHYANGREAKVGDLVRGKGYNVKHEIIGIVTDANPGATACNCTVAHVDVTSMFVMKGWLNQSSPRIIAWPNRILEDGSKEFTPQEVVAALEYGQLDAFVAIDPQTGEVLPPE